MAINAVGNTDTSTVFQKSNQSVSLTDAQKEIVASVLAEYDPDNLTEEDVAAINQVFHEAGIMPGDDFFEAVSEAGFDVESIRPAEPPDGTDQMAPPPPKGVSGLNTEALTELQNILENYSLEDLDEEDEASLAGELQAAGLLLPGLFLDDSA